MHARAAVISIWIVGLLMHVSYLCSQVSVVDEVLNKWVTELDDVENVDVTSITEDLNYFAEHPINLNNANRDDLERLPFLTSQQVEEILFYVYEYGEVYTLGELAAVDGLDSKTIELLMPFVTIRPLENNNLNWKNVWHYGKHELMVGNHLTLERQKGYVRTQEELAFSPSDFYLGDAVYASIKYTFHYKDRVEFGISTEKDAGEAFYGKFHKGYDFYNAYIQLRDIWHFSRIVAGNYRATFGQGLVLRTEFAMPEMSVTQISPRYVGLRKTSSTDEYNFMRGVGATLNFGGFSITPFYSFRYMDADTTGGTWTTIVSTGLHRKLSELEKRRTLPTHVVGANVGYDGKSYHVGLTSATNIYGLPQVHNNEVYAQMLDTGKIQSALSLDYKFRVHRFNFFGETAICTNRGIATINSLSYMPASMVELLFSHRYYSPHYDVLLANAYGGRTNNENGFYLGMHVSPIKRLNLEASADAYYRPWISYTVSKSMVYYKLLVRAEFKYLDELSMLGQFSYRSAEKNLVSPTIMQQTTMVNIGRYLYRLNCNVIGLNLQTRLEMNHAREGQGSLTFGYLLAQSASYTIQKIGLSFDALCAYFSAKDYNNRFQVYERNVPYQFSVPLLYGEGVRYHILIGYKAPRIFSAYVRLAQTYYTDGRITTGSGWDMIQSNHKTDLHVLVRFTF